MLTFLPFLFSKTKFLLSAERVYDNKPDLKTWGFVEFEVFFKLIICGFLCLSIHIS